jgi:octaprenyl-diphosphate synthase
MKEKTKSDLKAILKPIEGHLNRVDYVIQTRMLTGIHLLDESAMHHFKQGGKKVRAAMIILASGLKNEVPDDIVEVAAAAEMVHCASLIHDDIVDRSSQRRGDVTVSKKWGSRIAVLVGDYMYTRALEIAVGEARLDLFPIMVGAARDMIKGELYQIEYSKIDSITKEHYFNIIELKTARFMAACAKLGAVKAMMRPDESEILFQFGLNLGFAFQIVDDALDVNDVMDLAGKDSGNDFLNGKITLPFLHLLEMADGRGRDELAGYAKKPDQINWKIVRERIISSGSVDYCIEAAREYVMKAIKYLDFFPQSDYKDIILDLAYFLLDRRY